MACVQLLTVAACLVSLTAAEPPPSSYLPSFDLNSPSQSFSDYASSNRDPHVAPSYKPPQPTYGAPTPTPSYQAPKPTYGAPKRTYNAPKPARYIPPPTPAPVYSAPPAPAPVYSAPPPPAPVYSAPPPARDYLPASSGPLSSYSSHRQEEYDSEPANYMFQYTVQDHHYGTDFGHKESREGDVAHGQYMVLLPDGRRQIVDYIADQDGYRPTIRYEGEAGRRGGGY